eukprot:6181999-Pleurochrysis_carterae.AAC.2
MVVCVEESSKAVVSAEIVPAREKALTACDAWAKPLTELPKGRIPRNGVWIYEDSSTSLHILGSPSHTLTSGGEWECCRQLMRARPRPTCTRRQDH